MSTDLRAALDILEADARDPLRPRDWRYGVRHSVSVIKTLAATPEPAPAHVHVIPTNRLTESPEAPHEHVCTCGFHYFSDEVATPEPAPALDVERLA